MNLLSVVPNIAKKNEINLRESEDNSPNERLPFELKRKDLLIVDTPGFGPDDQHLTEKLYEYLPKALAFIYILNTSNAGGVQKDRILQIQAELCKYEGANRRFFDTNRAIFICNKWDLIRVDEDDPDEVFEKIKKKLLEAWIGFEEKKLFKLSAHEEIKNCKDGKPISIAFKEILNGIKEMIPATVDEKLQRHLANQKGFLESIQKKVTARIKTTMKSKEEKMTMIAKIKEKICNIETTLQVKWQSLTDIAEKKCSEVAKRIISHIHDPQTKAKMFRWSLGDLPDSSDYEQLQKDIDVIVEQKVKMEIKDRIENYEAIGLAEFVEHHFRDECYNISNEVDEIESLICGDDYEYARCQNRDGDNNGSRPVKLETREIVFLAVSAPILIPTSFALSVVFSLIVLPAVGAGFAIKDKMKNMKKVTEYRKDKSVLANKRAEVYFRQLTDDSFEQQLKTNLLKKMNETIDAFFTDAIPKKLSSAKVLITNIENDLREPAIIRATCHKVESLLKPIYGRALAAEMDVFGDNHIKRKDIINIKQKGDFVVATFINKKTNSQTVIKKVTFVDEKEDGWKCLAEINAFRRRKHHNLLKIYGVCVLEPRYINNKLYILQEMYDSDLAQEAIQNKRPWPENVGYLLGALDGLSHLHIGGLVHTNLRLESILIKDGIGKLAEIGDRNSGIIPAVRAPESLESDEYGYESDIFQFAMIIWECWYHERVYSDSKTIQDVSYRIQQGERPIIRLPMPREIENCLKSCWQNNPNERPSAKDIHTLINVSHYGTIV